MWVLMTAVCPHGIFKRPQASLKRLQIENIELPVLISTQHTRRQIWQAMDRLYQQGKITYVGLAIFGLGDRQANERALNQQRMGLVCEQGLCNLIEHAELEVLPACQQYGVGLTLESIGWGLVSGGSSPGQAPIDAVQEARQRARNNCRGSKLCADLGETPSNVALAWLLHQPGVTATIIGPADQLTNTLSVPDLMLNAETLDKSITSFHLAGPLPRPTLVTLGGLGALRNL